MFSVEVKMQALTTSSVRNDKIPLNHTVLLGSDFIDKAVYSLIHQNRVQHVAVLRLSNSLYDSNNAATRRFVESFHSSGRGLLEWRAVHFSLHKKTFFLFYWRVWKHKHKHKTRPTGFQTGLKNWVKFKFIEIRFEGVKKRMGEEKNGYRLTNRLKMW